MGPFFSLTVEQLDNVCWVDGDGDVGDLLRVSLDDVAVAVLEVDEEVPLALHLEEVGGVHLLADVLVGHLLDAVEHLHKKREIQVA